MSSKMANAILFSEPASGLSLRPQDMQQALPLADVEYLIDLQKKDYRLVLVNPGIGNVAQVFATDNRCKSVLAVAGTPVFSKTINFFELDDFVSIQNEIPTDELDSSVVIWDDMVGGTMALSDKYVNTLRRARMFVLRKPMEWIPPTLGVWERRDASDRRSALFTYNKSAPAPDVPVAGGGVLVGMITPEEKREWQIRLVAFLRTFLANFIKAPALDRYFEPQFLKTWYDAFTHEVVDPNANYETLEFIGDLALENAVGKYLVARFPQATKGQYNEMKRALVEKQGLKAVSQALGLSSMLLTFKNTQHIAEDVVESFLGALAGVSDRLVPGLGDVNVYNYVVWYYNKRDINPEREGQMPPKTIVQQTFEKFFDQKTVKQEEAKVPGGVRVSAVIPQSVVVDMKKKYNKDIPMVLGEAVGPTAKAASAKAYQLARDLLNQRGITFEWAERVQRERELNSPEMRRFYEAARDKARGEGYTELVLLKSSTLAGKDGTLVGLAGVRPDGQKVTVAVGEGSQRFEASVAAMKAYSGMV